MPKFIHYYFTLFLGILTVPCFGGTEFKLSMPLRCNYGDDCFIQNYVDLKTTSQYQDYNCGILTYNNHKGTDFRLVDYKGLVKGVEVLAVADGTVKAVRNDEADFIYIKNNYSGVTGKECGNGIILQHNDGYSTQYCHLSKNSIVVSEGQKLKSGDKIGYVGMSGETEFPHLHITIRQNDKIIDPFTGLEPNKIYTCSDKNTSNSLWDSNTLKNLKYIETAILNFYLTENTPSQLEAQAGNFREDTIKQDAENIIFWTEIVGVNKNDEITFELINSSQQTVFSSTQKVPKRYAVYFSYVGKKISKNDDFSPGKYKEKISLKRNKKIILTKVKDITLD